MQLILTKDQSKGLLGNVKFEVKAQVQLTDQEQELIQHYKLQNEILLSKKLINIWGQPTDEDVNVTVSNLLNGEVYKCKDLGEVIAYSDNLVTACETLKAYLEVANDFGGETVIEIE